MEMTFALASLAALSHESRLPPSVSWSRPAPTACRSARCAKTSNSRRPRSPRTSTCCAPPAWCATSARAASSACAPTTSDGCTARLPHRELLRGRPVAPPRPPPAPPTRKGPRNEPFPRASQRRRPRRRASASIATVRREPTCSRPTTRSGCSRIRASTSPSHTGRAPGVDHLGIQADSGEALAMLGTPPRCRRRRRACRKTRPSAATRNRTSCGPRTPGHALGNLPHRRRSDDVLRRRSGLRDRRRRLHARIRDEPAMTAGGASTRQRRAAAPERRQLLAEVATTPP